VNPRSEEEVEVGETFPNSNKFSPLLLLVNNTALNNC